MNESQNIDKQKEETAKKLKECLERARRDLGLDPLPPWHNEMTKKIAKKVLNKYL